MKFSLGDNSHLCKLFSIWENLRKFTAVYVIPFCYTITLTTAAIYFNPLTL